MVLEVARTGVSSEAFNNATGLKPCEGTSDFLATETTRAQSSSSTIAKCMDTFDDVNNQVSSCKLSSKNGITLCNNSKITIEGMLLSRQCSSSGSCNSSYKNGFPIVVSTNVTHDGKQTNTNNVHEIFGAVATFFQDADLLESEVSNTKRLRDLQATCNQNAALKKQKMLATGMNVVNAIGSGTGLGGSDGIGGVMGAVQGAAGASGGGAGSVLQGLMSGGALQQIMQ
jgi:hypothetical protein